MKVVREQQLVDKGVVFEPFNNTGCPCENGSSCKGA